MFTSYYSIPVICHSTFVGYVYRISSKFPIEHIQWGAFTGVDDRSKKLCMNRFKKSAIFIAPNLARVSQIWYFCLVE